MWLTPSTFQFLSPPLPLRLLIALYSVPTFSSTHNDSLATPRKPSYFCVCHWSTPVCTEIYDSIVPWCFTAGIRSPPSTLQSFSPPLPSRIIFALHCFLRLSCTPTLAPWAHRSHPSHFCVSSWSTPVCRALYNSIVRLLLHRIHLPNILFAPILLVSITIPIPSSSLQFPVICAYTDILATSLTLSLLLLPLIHSSL